MVDLADTGPADAGAAGRLRRRPTPSHERDAAVAEAPAASRPGRRDDRSRRNDRFRACARSASPIAPSFSAASARAFALYRLVEGGRFIAVIGSSGSGKSSLVLAGLQGLLAEETADAGGPSWRLPRHAPRRRADHAARARARASSPTRTVPMPRPRRRDRIEWTLAPVELQLRAARSRRPGGLNGRSLLLVVDQFEELFRFGLAGLALRRTSLDDDARPRRGDPVRPDPARRRPPPPEGRARADHDALRLHRRLRLFPRPVGGGQRDAVPRARTSRAASSRTSSASRSKSRARRSSPSWSSASSTIAATNSTSFPVLQHCLMRLWDRAGSRKRGAPAQLTRADLRRHRPHGRSAVAPRRRDAARNAPARSSPSSRLFARSPNSTATGARSAARCASTELLAETGVAESRSQRRPRPVPRPRLLVPRASAALAPPLAARRPSSTSAMRLCCAAGRSSSGGPARSIRDWAAAARLARPRSRATASATASCSRCSATRPRTRRRRSRTRWEPSAGGTRCRARPPGPSATAASSTVKDPD